MLKIVDKISNVECLFFCYENNLNFCVDDFVNFFEEFFEDFYIKKINLDEINYFYLKFPKIFSIFLKLKIFNKIEYEKMLNFFVLILDVISNKKKIKKIPFYKINNKKIKLIEFLIISLLQNIKNFNENEIFNNFLNKNFSLNFQFNLKIFEYLFNFLLNFNKKNYLNFFINKIIFEMKNNNKNLLFIFCLEKMFFFIKKNIENLKNFDDLIKNENKLILNFIQNFYFFYHQNLKKLNNNFNFIDFFNVMKNYLNNKNENEIFDFLNVIFYLKLIKFGIKFFNNNLKLIKEKNNFFSLFLNYIEKCENLCKNLNKNKIEFLKKIYFLKENFNFLENFYSNKKNIIFIIFFINNQLNENSNEFLLYFKEKLIKLFKIEQNIPKLNEKNYSNFNNKLFINKIINFNKFSPWEMPKQNYKEFFILFYFFRFLSLIIDFFKGNKIEDFTKPKTNLRLFCNINYILRIFSIVFVVFLLVYLIKILNNNY